MTIKKMVTATITLDNEEVEHLQMMAELARLYIQQEQKCTRALGHSVTRDRSKDVSHYSCGSIQRMEAGLMEGIFSL